MAQLTQEYLEGLGFTLSWSKYHNFKEQYAKYDSDVSSGIILVSQTDILQVLKGASNLVFNVWFYGQGLNGNFEEIDSHMSVSSVEDLDAILKLLNLNTQS